MKGYEELRSTAAWIDLTARGKIRLTGEDRARLLHAMTTNHVQDLKPGGGCYAFFLNAQGRILADANILCFADHLLLDTEPEVRQKLFEHLDQFIIADDVTLTDLTSEVATVSIEGPTAADVLTAAGAPIPEPEGASLSWGDRTVARLNTTGQLGFFVFLPLAQLVDFTAALGIVQADPAAARTARIENGKPRYGEEITDRYLVQETGQMRAVHPSKGCYLGQEIVERVKSRGQVHRHLRGITLNGSVPPPAGSKLQLDGKDVAELASAVYSPTRERCVGMAYVRTEALRPGTILAGENLTAEVLAA